ncbi:MAG: hypothetical protein ACTSVO_03745, partial [Candidatus Heimdallarchaeaceae archaeon]
LCIRSMQCLRNQEFRKLFPAHRVCSHWSSLHTKYAVLRNQDSMVTTIVPSVSEVPRRGI